MTRWTFFPISFPSYVRNQASQSILNGKVNKNGIATGRMNLASRMENEGSKQTDGVDVNVIGTVNRCWPVQWQVYRSWQRQKSSNDCSDTPDPGHSPARRNNDRALSTRPHIHLSNSQSCSSTHWKGLAHSAFDWDCDLISALCKSLQKVMAITVLVPFDGEESGQQPLVAQ